MDDSLGLYERCVLPGLLHVGMNQAQLRPLRSALIGAAEGRILEVGVGSGINIGFYRRDVVQVIGIDPSIALLTKAKKAVAWAACPVRLLEGRAECLPIATASIDTVVMTWTLCSIADPIGALGEIRRVLRPGGSLLFLEHGLAPDHQPWVRSWQNGLTPYWKRIAGNCHLNRRIDGLLAASGLNVTELEKGYLVSGPKAFTFHYRGSAVIA
ncbi:MAG: class I SAM-dependent methyltransferase [Geminicoccaceae bacterium]